MKFPVQLWWQQELSSLKYNPLNIIINTGLSYYNYSCIWGYICTDNVWHLGEEGFQSFDIEATYQCWCYPFSLWHGPTNPLGKGGIKLYWIIPILYSILQQKPSWRHKPRARWGEYRWGRGEIQRSHPPHSSTWDPGSVFLCHVVLNRKQNLVSHISLNDIG